MTNRTPHFPVLRQAGHETEAHFFKARFRPYELPPVKDAIVVGTAAPVAVEVLLQTLKLVSPDPFVAVAVADQVIAALILRASLLKRLSADVILKFALARVKPAMVRTDVLRLDLEVEIVIEGSI